MNGFKSWEQQVTDKSNLPAAINRVTAEWAATGQHLTDADTAITRALAIVDALKKDSLPRKKYLSPKQVKENRLVTGYKCADTYALILYKENKYKEALAYEESVYDNTKDRDTGITTHFAMILNANDLYTKAQAVIKESYAAGITSPALGAQLEKCYVKINGSDKGFAGYLQSLDTLADRHRLAEIAKTMFSLPAPAFDLRDISGNHVTLEGLKGKVVVIDFWANWCAPCKESFPDMQSVINKYKTPMSSLFLSTPGKPIAIKPLGYSGSSQGLIDEISLLTSISSAP